MNKVDKRRNAHDAFNRRDGPGMVQDFARCGVDRARRVTLKGPQETVESLKET